MTTDSNLQLSSGHRPIARAIPAIRTQSGDVDARSDALYGAWLCGTVLGNVGMALHHKLCHTLGGSFNLPHAEVHTVVLPHAMAFNAEATPVAMQSIARALQRSSAAAGLFDLAADNGAPVALKDIGMRQEDLDKAADIAVANPYWNPRPFGKEQRDLIRDLLQRAFEGIRPT
jgi:alcohol dehydrogenase class IV